jgi:methylated-DNA-[protein]-cysteine S-methyltransferase
MTYKWIYKTPDQFSNILMTSDGEFLTGLWFVESRDAKKHVIDSQERLIPVFEETIHWLDVYFSGREPDFVPSYKIENLTDFRREVSDYMKTIPYGETVTYGEIASAIAKKRGIKRMSAQAVGGAVGWNPISLIIPCHRVMGADNAITGYGGGIENKIALLKLEGHRFI